MTAPLQAETIVARKEALMPTIPPVTRIYVRLRPDEIKRLGDDAQAERRPVADHTAYLLSRALAGRTQTERTVSAP